MPAAASFAAIPPPKKLPLQPELVQILRVQEATNQEARLLKTGKYKSLQRLNVKRAINFMIENYDLNQRFVNAAAYSPDVAYAAQLGNTAVESLTQIIEYFPQKLVANDLTAAQSAFVLKALGTTSTAIDNFMKLMPEETVRLAKGQIAEENSLNESEYSEVDDEGKVVGTTLINVPPSKS